MFGGTGQGGAARRMAAFIAAHGARVTIERKIAGAWTTVDTGRPCMVEPQQGGAAIGIDAMDTGRDGASLYRLTLELGAQLVAGDRVTVESGMAVDPGPMTVTAPRPGSLDVATQVLAMVEQVAVETYVVTVERWDDAATAYAVVLTASAQVLGGGPTQDRGVSGAEARGATATLVFRPIPGATIGVGDWVRGVPWAAGATVRLVRPVVGDRLEIEISYQRGGE